MIVGETNLPDNTELMTSVTGKTTGFMGQQKTSVQGGRFKAGPFGPAEGLKPGQYAADVTMPIPRVQPDSVRAIIGENGEKLKGPLVSKEVLGPSINLEQTFKITSSGIVQAPTDRKAVQAAYNQAINQAKEILEALKQLEQIGRNLDRTPASIQKCMEQMQGRMQKAEALVHGANAGADAKGRSLIDKG